MKSKRNEKNFDTIDLTPSMHSPGAQPENSIEQINKYGTYNIQPTNDSDNSFPKIAQGLAKPQNRKAMQRKKKTSRDIF